MLSDEPLMARASTWVVAVLLLAVVLTPALIGCASTSCEEEERIGYPELERLADEVMADVNADVFRVGACEDTGQPGASVAASVSAWSTREEADSYLSARGWTPVANRRHTLLSPDGHHNAHYILVSQDNVVIGIEVRFSVAR